MPVSPSELSQYSDKSVQLVLERDGEQVTVQGKIELASEVGVAFKQKRKRDVDFIEPSEIVSITEIEDTGGDLRQKKLPPLEASKARAHLIDRHGAPLPQVNNLTNEQALELHNKIDHKDLGHKHLTAEEQAEKERKAAEKKAAEANAPAA